MQKTMTTREVAESLDARARQMPRPYELQQLPKPAHSAAKLAIPASRLRSMVKALADRSWLPGATTPNHADRMEANHG